MIMINEYGKTWFLIDDYRMKSREKNDKLQETSSYNENQW